MSYCILKIYHLIIHFSSFTCFTSVEALSGVDCLIPGTGGGGGGGGATGHGGATGTTGESSRGIVLSSMKDCACAGTKTKVITTYSRNNSAF